MARTMPFGYPRGYIAQAPAPRTGMTVTPSGYSESVDFENGGAAVVNSSGKHNVYGMSFAGDSSQVDGIGVFREFATGLYGNGLLYFSDPMAYDTNLLPPHWATPHLCEKGWKKFAIGTPTFSDRVPTPGVPYPRQAAFSITSDANAVPTHPSKVATILIPPTHKLHFGFKGVAAGDAKLMYVPIRIGGTPEAARQVTLISATNDTQMNTNLDGAVYQAVEIYAMRSAATPSVLTILSGMAQLWRRTLTPNLTGRHQAGQGHTGVRFGDGAQQETYVMTRGHYKQLSTTFVEVGAWL